MKSKSTNNFFNFSDRKDLVAILKPEVSISYKELFEQSNQIAFSISHKGIKKDNYIPLLIDDNLLFIKTVIALWELGAVPVPLNSKFLDEEIYSLLDHYNFRFLISSKRNLINIRVNELDIIDLSQLEIEDSKVSIFSPPVLEKEAVVIFTSGSTGRPKGVVHTFSSLISSIKNGNEILNHKETDRWLSSLPFYHIGGFQIVCRSLFSGCSIILPQSLQTDVLTKSIKEFNPTHLSLVSTQLDKLIQQNIKPNDSLKISLIGGGFVDDELMIEADKLGWKPYRVYGSSETASMVTAISVNEIKTKPQSVGKALNNVQINIAEDSEILVKSDSLFLKYLSDESETKLKLVDDYYYTGDLGFLDDDGYLFIEARRTDLIVTGGENVNPIEVEKVVLNIKGIKEVCVFPKPSKTWGQIVACAIVKEDESINEIMIKENLKKIIAGYKIPKEFIFTNELPRTSLGKFEREKIRKMF
jgi:O-succinylbenzoic acid--CoA ligase